MGTMKTLHDVAQYIEEILSQDIEIMPNSPVHLALKKALRRNEQSTEQLLKKAFDKAVSDMQEGPYASITVGQEVNVGRTQLLSGKDALVKLELMTDPDDIEFECDDFDSLPRLK